jgi:hypothetical protein
MEPSGPFEPNVVVIKRKLIRAIQESDVNRKLRNLLRHPPIHLRLTANKRPSKRRIHQAFLNRRKWQNRPALKIRALGKANLLTIIIVRLHRPGALPHFS